MEQRFQADKAAEVEIHLEHTATALGMPIGEATKLLIALSRQSMRSPQDFLWAMRQWARNGWLKAEDLREHTELTEVASLIMVRSMGIDPK